MGAGVVDYLLRDDKRRRNTIKSAESLLAFSTMMTVFVLLSHRTSRMLRSS